LDETAISIVKVTDDGKWWAKEIIHGRWDIRQTAATILKAIRDYRPISVGIEKGSLKNAVLPYLSDLMRKNNVYSHIVDLTHGNRKKTDRIIWSLQGRFEHGRIILNQDEDWDWFIDQLLLFPSIGVHDDGVDSFSYIDQLAVTSYFVDNEEDEWEPIDIISGV
jgi:phage terminase large subunit-like protein